MINSNDDSQAPGASESHHVTFFAPDRPVDGSTVYTVDRMNDEVDPLDEGTSCPRCVPRFHGGSTALR